MYVSSCNLGRSLTNDLHSCNQETSSLQAENKFVSCSRMLGFTVLATNLRRRKALASTRSTTMPAASLYKICIHSRQKPLPSAAESSRAEPWNVTWAKQQKLARHSADEA